MYDITNEKSFENIKNWMRNIEEHSSSDVQRMIIANKCDMDDRRQISRDRGESVCCYFHAFSAHAFQLAIEHGCKFMETSAKANLNVENTFFTLARDIMLKTERDAVRVFVSVLFKYQSRPC